MITQSIPSKTLICMLALALFPRILQAECDPQEVKAEPGVSLPCKEMENVTIFGSAVDVRDIAGGASLVSNEDLKAFSSTDVVRAIRRVPGVSLQVEDGYGLRPNISIRGTATERSSRVTLLEDNVLIAPAPYTAPSAYYFPTFGRINSIEVLKGPASITHGPYTVGGAVNLTSTPIPETEAGHLTSELGSDSTTRLHGWYGGGTGRWGYLLETHQWKSDGYQHIDRSASDTGLDKQDYLAKFSFRPDTAGAFRHSLDIKLQSSEEQSRQSYLGLTDTDFGSDALRRYGLSALGEMDNEHQQVTATWRIQPQSGPALTLTAYHNEFERAWYKTEGMDFDGSADAQSFSRTSWARIVDAVNRGVSLGGLSPQALQAVLDGADTAAGSIQLRNNARSYYSRGLQVTAELELDLGTARHGLQAGLRYHEDEEDRLQRNDTYQQLDGRLLLSDRGLEGNAGNRIQNAEAWALFLHDRIDWQGWTFTPGVRYESIDLNRTDFHTSGPNPASREAANFKGSRQNSVDVWIPGVGVLYDFSNGLRMVAGIHKGFATPGNKPGVEPEESINYELGIRHRLGAVEIDLMAFFNDYDNLVGVCTNSSGTDCEPGDSFNGDGARIPGLELTLLTELNSGNGWHFPLQLAYTWMDAEFRTSFDSEFFGEVTRGDPVPYIPEHQAWASAGAIKGPFSGFLSASYEDSVCTQASCAAFERTESAVVLDLALNYRINRQWEVYVVAENLTDEIYVAGREPYGARSNKPRAYVAGARLNF